MRHTRKRKRQLHSLDKYVIFSISVLLIYTIVALWASFRGVSNDTLTTCVFATWGGEILSCALIKIFKLREENEKTEEADL